MRDFSLYCEKKVTESLTLVDNRDEREGQPFRGGEEEEEKYAKQQQIMLIYNNFAVIE